MATKSIKLASALSLQPKKNIVLFEPSDGWLTPDEVDEAGVATLPIPLIIGGVVVAAAVVGGVIYYSRKRRR